VSLSQHSETGERPQASVVFTVEGKEVKGESDGNGPVDASLKAIESHVKSGAEMVLYSVNAISGSTESQGEVTVRLQNSGGWSTAWAPTPTSWWRRPRLI
jgi:2-isopropylmalate synthase